MIGDLTIERLFHSLIKGDSSQARRLIEGILAEGASVDELIFEAYRPIAAMIESLCRASQLSAQARDHATVLLQNLLDDAQAGQLTAGEALCEIETTIHHEANDPIEDRIVQRLRSLAPPPRESQLISPFTRMTFRHGVLRVKLVGPQVNEREAKIMREEIDRALDLVGPGLKAFILDLSEVELLSSLGLNLCIELRNRVASLEARAVMTGVSHRLMDLFARMNVDRLYERAGAELAFAEFAA